MESVFRTWEKSDRSTYIYERLVNSKSWWGSMNKELKRSTIGGVERGTARLTVEENEEVA